MITAPLDIEAREVADVDEGTGAGALVKHASGTAGDALITSTDANASLSLNKPPPQLEEVAVPENHPLAQALATAGLPATALVSTEDGALVPLRETTSGTGEGRGRGDDERARRLALEKGIMGEEEREHLPLDGSGGDMWGYKVC